MASLDTLMRELDFTPVDLAANQRGELSPSQRDKLTPPNPRLSALSNGCFTFGMIGVLTLCPASFAATFWNGYQNTGSISWLIATGGLMVLSLTGFVLGIHAARLEHDGTQAMNKALAQDVQENRVLSVIATIETDEVGEHIYAVNDPHKVTLYLENDVMQVGERYRVYYIPHANLLLTAEPLDD